MKVCVTGLRGIPRVMGGVETHCEELYPRLKALLPQTQFEVLGRKPYVDGAPFDFSGVTVTPLANLPSKYTEAISHTLISLVYARFVAKAEVVHIHAIGPGVLAPLGRLLGLKVVVTHHGEDYRRQKWNALAKAVLRTGEWLSVAAAGQVIVVALTLSEQLKGRYRSRESRIVYIPNGMAKRASEPVEGRRDVLSRLGLTPRTFVLGVGRLVPEKRFDDLIEAVEQLGGDAKLVIAGGADHADKYSRDLLERAGERVLFAGRLEANELDQLYRNCAVFVLASSHEGLPITALEAVAAGAPVLLSDIGPNRDVGLPADNYFPMGDVAALKARLQAGVFDGLRVDARAVAERFDWGRIADQTAEVYRTFGCQ